MAFRKAGLAKKGRRPVQESQDYVQYGEQGLRRFRTHQAKSVSRRSSEMSQSKKRNVNAVSSKALLPPLHVLPTPTKTGRATKTGETGRSGPRSQDPTVRSSVQPSSSDVRMGAAQSVEGVSP